jgi:hypothetical protein
LKRKDPVFFEKALLRMMPPDGMQFPPSSRFDSDIRPQTSDIRLREVNGQRSFKVQVFDVSPRLELGPKAHPNGTAGLQRNWVTESRRG